MVDRALERLEREWVDIPLFQGVSPADISLEKIGGGKQNVVYRLELGGLDIAVRLCGEKGPRSRKDNVQEYHNQKIAASYGLCSSVLYAGVDTGTLIYPFLEGESLHRTNMPDDADAQSFMAFLLARLHGLPVAFQGSKNPMLNRIRRRQEKLTFKKGGSGAVLREFSTRLESMLMWSERHSGPSTPIHADCIPINVIDTGAQYRLIDWQLSGMGDPFYDVGTFLVESELSNDQIDNMLDIYFRELGGALPACSGTQDYEREKCLINMVMKSWFWCLSFEQKIQDGLDVSNNRKFLKRRLGQMEYLLDNDLIKQAFRVVGL